MLARPLCRSTPHANAKWELHSRAVMAEPTKHDIDALWGPATPQFAYQIADRINNLIGDLPAGNPVRAYGELRLAELDELGHGTTKGPEPGH